MKNKTSLGSLAASLLCVLTATAATAETPTPAPKAPASPSYQLQPGDVVEISVWKETDMKRDALVRPDGGLSFPLVGDLSVRGMTPQELQQEIQARLGKYIADATVTVSVLQINGNQVFIVGKVNRPGAYKLDRPLDVMQALSLAGGTTEFAGVDDIKILRRGADGRQRAIEFAYSAVSRGRSLDQNIVLQSGDTVVVP